MGFFEDWNVDPYEFLGVSDFCQDPHEIKKAYKAKSLLLHPDKTMGKTEVEFKILGKCYKYAIKNIVEIQKDHSQMKSEHKAATENGNQRDWAPENKLYMFETERDLLFHQDTLDRNFEKTIERVSKLPTSYSPVDTYDSTFKEKMMTNGKFNREKFNVLFSEINKKKKRNDELINYTGPVASNESQLQEYTNVHADDDGVMLNSVNSVSVNEVPPVSQHDIDKILEIDIKKINTLIKKSKKDTGKISRKKFKEALNEQMSRGVPEITEKRSYSEMDTILEQKKLEELKNSRQAQTKYVSSNKIFRCINV